jgi:hypothetical protein
MSDSKSERSKVGLDVGTDDGGFVSPSSVGALVVGAFDGTDEGCLVGWLVGCVEGRPLGSIVGRIDGCAVGIDVGWFEGRKLG